MYFIVLDSRSDEDQSTFAMLKKALVRYDLVEVSLFCLGPVSSLGLSLCSDCYYCRVEARPGEGRYDLHISHANYDRDNGKFECRVKEDGTGVELYTVTISLTVLLPPGPPAITKSSLEAVEGQPYSLTCSSRGGSPPPEISWLRLSDGAHLTGNTTLPDSRDGQTVSKLEIVPRKQDDGAIFRCDVTNRAISSQAALSTDLTISVNCE